MVFSLHFYADSGENLSLADLILESAGFLFFAPSFRLSSYDCAPELVFAPFWVYLQGDVPHLTSTFPSTFRSIFVSVAALSPSSCSHGSVFWQSNAVLLACDHSPKTCRGSHTDWSFLLCCYDRMPIYRFPQRAGLNTIQSSLQSSVESHLGCCFEPLMTTVERQFFHDSLSVVVAGSSSLEILRIDDCDSGWSARSQIYPLFLPIDAGDLATTLLLWHLIWQLDTYPWSRLPPLSGLSKQHHQFLPPIWHYAARSPVGPRRLPHACPHRSLSIDFHPENPQNPRHHL